MADNLQTRAEERVDIKIKFYKNLGSYIIVNVFLAIINWLFTPFFWWVLFPVFFWGIGVLIDFIKTFVVSNYFNENYRERKVQEEMEKIKSLKS
ncbi:MAG: 2TM domain-containing protein [Methanobrevibacter thaueri]|nr:2TM domain-containing protein [Methanobrevibacter thaueri]